MVRRRVVHRQGHSLVELIVAVTFLGVTLAAVTGSTLLGARWVGEAAEEQRAVRLAEDVLDSLAASTAPAPGTLDRDGLRLRWTVGPAGRLTVTVGREGRGPALARLEGRSVPALTVVPNPDPALVPGSGLP